jgi:hypothetical protein
MILDWWPPQHPDLWQDGMLFSALLAPLGGFVSALVVIDKRLPSVWTPYPIGCCQSCGYDRRGLGSEQTLCPECGRVSLSKHRREDRAADRVVDHAVDTEAI